MIRLLRETIIPVAALIVAMEIVMVAGMVLVGAR